MVQWPGWLMAVVLPVAQYSCSLNVFPFLKCCVLNACTPNFCLHDWGSAPCTAKMERGVSQETPKRSFE